MNDQARDNVPTAANSSETPVDEHLSWIDAACREVQAAGGKASSGLGSHEPNVSTDDRIAAALSRALPSYTIQGECQRGGQGVVFRAVQNATDRHVAIKVLHETSSVKARDRARFEREVKILGQLRHPNIVKILDTGSTEGRFFYIMDYIDGMPLDDYVLKNNVSIHDALILFEKVCHAVNVAHLRGIIHRDIKPSNIRVDHSGEPHVMDFGLAKVDEFDAIADPRTEVQTVSGQFVGTLPWASPEQLEGSTEDLDIRTDVYSLGIVLYQILARSFPYEVGGSMRKTLENICHIDPEKPSSINPNIDDEVDCIVLKALRKRREDRYQSAGNLAREIHRCLVGEPIEAKRDNGWYVLRKTIRRHRGKAIIAGLAVVLIVHSLIAMTILFRQESRLRADAEKARDQARQASDEARQASDEAKRQERIAQEVNAFLNFGVLASARPDQMGKDVTVHEALTAASADIEEYFPGEPEMQARIRFVVGNTFYELGDIDEAVKNLQRSLEQFRETLGPDDPETLHAMNDLARVYDSTGKYEEALRLFEECLERRNRVLGEDHADTVTSIVNLGWANYKLGNGQEAEDLSRQAVEGWSRVSGDHEQETRQAVNILAAILMERNKHAEAEPLLLDNYEWSRKNLGEDHPGTLISMGNLASVYKDMERYNEAESLYRRALDARKRVLGIKHPDTILSMNNLAVLHSNRGQYEQAAAVLEEALNAGREANGNDHPMVISVTSNLGKAYHRLQRFEEAITMQESALESARRTLPENHSNIGLYMTRAAATLSELAQTDRAETMLDDAYDLLLQSVGPSDPLTINVIEFAIKHYESRGMTTEVEVWNRRMAEGN